MPSSIALQSSGPAWPTDALHSHTVRSTSTCEDQAPSKGRRARAGLAKLWQALTDPSWASLRAVGNLRFLKISYVLLVFIPVLTTQNAVTDFLGFDQWLLAVTFFASLSLAVANGIYDIWCPPVIKRFESPNDLYDRMLQIKKLSVELYPRDSFIAFLAHCKDAYRNHGATKRWARVPCAISYWVAVILFGILFANRAYVVTRAMF